MTSIERSTGTPVVFGGVVQGMAGDGYRGCTAELDALVAEAAAALAEAYGADVEIRFNSDRESGGAWLKTADGRSNQVGITASLVTARHRARVEASAARCEAEASTGRASWQAQPMTARQRRGARASARLDREWLAENPEGRLTVFAFLECSAVIPALRAELACMPGWNDMCGRSGAYHCGEAATVAEALARCLLFNADWLDDLTRVKLGLSV
jgi:hypothetical protein